MQGEAERALSSGRSADARSSVPRASRHRLIEKARRFLNHHVQRAPIATKGAPHDCHPKTVAIPPRPVDAPSAAARNTVAITPLRHSVAPIGSVAKKGAAEPTVAPVEREC